VRRSVCSRDFDTVSLDAQRDALGVARDSTVSRIRSYHLSRSRALSMATHVHYWQRIRDSSRPAPSGTTHAPRSAVAAQLILAMHVLLLRSSMPVRILIERDPAMGWRLSAKGTAPDQ